MTVSFSDALSAMSSTLGAADLEASGVTYDVVIGDEFVAESSRPPSILIVPTTSTPQSIPQQSLRGQPVVVQGELSGFNAVFWHADANATVENGLDYVAVQKMRATFAAAMRATFGSAFKLGPGQWESTDGGSYNELGRKYLQQFTIATALMGGEDTRAPIAQTTANIGISNPGTDYVNP